MESDSRCPKISQYQVLPKFMQGYLGYFTELCSTILKRVALFAFADLIQLMSPEAVHVLVYCGIIALYGYLIMFTWGCVYFPYALARALLRYGLILILILAVLGLLSGFTGGFEGLNEALLKGKYSENLSQGVGKFKEGLEGLTKNSFSSVLGSHVMNTLKSLLGFDNTDESSNPYTSGSHQRYNQAQRNGAYGQGN
jgi:hypothetical protein